MLMSNRELLGLFRTDKPLSKNYILKTNRMYSNIETVVNLMIEKGLLGCEPDPKDETDAWLYLTDNGILYRER